LDSYKYRRRARRPRLSHRSLDWQPNDHLGRSCFRPHLFEYRRQILRGYTKSDTDAYSDGDRDSHSHSYGYIHADTNGYVHTYAHAHAYSDANCHRDFNSDAYTESDANTVYREMFTYPEASA
jgi:hypothetical protein